MLRSISLSGETAVEKKLVRPFVDAYELQDGRTIHILGEGRLINLASAEGHPASVMDMSFANQALSAEYMLRIRRFRKKFILYQKILTSKLPV